MGDDTMGIKMASLAKAIGVVRNEQEAMDSFAALVATAVHVLESHLGCVIPDKKMGDVCEGLAQHIIRVVQLHAVPGRRGQAEDN